MVGGVLPQRGVFSPDIIQAFHLLIDELGDLQNCWQSWLVSPHELGFICTTGVLPPISAAVSC